MVNHIKNLFSGKKNRSELSEKIKTSIDEFLDKYFPKKADTFMEYSKLQEMIKDYDDMEKLVRSVKSIGFLEKQEVDEIFEKLYQLFFMLLDRYKKDILLVKQDVSTVINLLKIVRHITVHRLERTHKDISNILEIIRLKTEQIKELYFDKSFGGKIPPLLYMALKTDLHSLNEEINKFKEAIKKSPDEYKKKLEIFGNIVKALDILILHHLKQEGNFIVFYDNEQILQKLDLLIETAKE